MRKLFRNKKIEQVRNDITNNQDLTVAGQVLAVLTRPDGSKQYFETHNIVTNQGDRYYAATAVGTAFSGRATGDFRQTGYMRLGTSLTAAAKSDTDVGSAIPSGSVALDAGYPAVSDTDPDNTGAGSNIVTWRFTFSTAIANANAISEGAITGSTVGGGYTGGAAGTALTHFLFASSFNKTSSDTLKVFVNHTMSGV